MLQERNVTAVYDSFETADLVRAALEDEGIELARVHVVPDRVAGIDDAADVGLYDNVIEDLGLPDADAHAYRDAVRRGDFVVSAIVESSHVARVEEIMRDPEAYERRGAVAAQGDPTDPRAEARPLEPPMPIGR